MWKAEQYANNIIKLTCKPDDYSNNENITDAVILKPVPVDFKLFLKDDTLVIGNAKLVAVHHNNTYRGFRFLLDDDEKIFGGGERALPLNRRGYRFNLYNQASYAYKEGEENLNFSIPFFTSSKMYGLFFDNGSKGYADIGKTNHQIFETGFVSGELNVFIITGNDYKEILTSFQKLTGTQPLPPKWALGNLMSRFGYSSEEQVKDIARKMKEQQIPFDAVIFDLFWFGDSIKSYLGNLDWVNKTKWPNPNKMIADFKKQNIHTVLITEPFILENTKNYHAALPYLAKDSSGEHFRLTDFYFGNGGLIDIFRKDAAEWIWNYHYKKQIANGITGWWTDLGEPERHPFNMLHNAKDEGINRMLGADEVHNIYGHYWNKRLYEHYTKDYSNTRLFHLNRSGFAGSQRFSIFPWTGDVSRTWSGLRAQLDVVLGMSMSGIPYVHSDAGGFAGGDGDNELYVRWLQFAAFTPIFRPHGTALYELEPGNFSFPSEAALIDEPYRSYARDIIKMRYSFLPYNYTLAYKQTQYGQPLIAPLYYHFPHDKEAISIQDEFMWGNDILVAPVTEKNSSERKLYLPEGNWYDVIHKEIIEGNKWITVKAAIQEIPYYYKAGSFIARNFADNISTVKDTIQNLSVQYTMAAHASKGEVFFDDGITANTINKKKFALLKLESSGLINNKLILTSSVEGSDSSIVKKQNNFSFRIPIEQKPLSVSINGKQMKIVAVKVKGWFAVNPTVSVIYNEVDNEKVLTILMNKISFKKQTIQIAF